MRKDEIYPLIDEILPHQPVLLTDIPDIDLYVDQVTGFIEKSWTSKNATPRINYLLKL